MHDDEMTLFKSMVACSSRYLEFGAGGSTILACDLVEASVISVDSSMEWLEKVKAGCSVESAHKLRTVYADIGPVGEWGAPVDESRRGDWPNYHASIWDDDLALSVDLVLVDGRFRVACALQAFLHLPGDTLVILHDFANRPQYHGILEFGREIVRAGQLSALVRRRGFSQMECRQAVLKFMFDPR